MKSSLHAYSPEQERDCPLERRDASVRLDTITSGDTSAEQDIVKAQGQDR